MKRFVLVCVSALLATTAHADDVKLRSITVSGQAERKVVPDEAHMFVSLNAQEAKIADAKAKYDEKLKKLMAIVANAGIEEKKVRTQTASIQPIYSYHNAPTKKSAPAAICPKKGNCIQPPPIPEPQVRMLDGYRVQSTLDVTVSDISKVGALMEEITNSDFEKGATEEWNSLLNVSYTVANPDKLRDDILADAIKNARAKATKMAVAAGADLGAVQRIAEGSVPHYNPVPMPMMAMARAENMMAPAAAIAKPVTPPAGEQDLEASVTVTFELK